MFTLAPFKKRRVKVGGLGKGVKRLEKGNYIDNICHRKETDLVTCCRMRQFHPFLTGYDIFKVYSQTPEAKTRLKGDDVDTS